MKCLLPAKENVSLQGVDFDLTDLVFAYVTAYSDFYLPFL